MSLSFRLYISLLNTNPELLFKVLYPILFSISPLVVYIIARKYIGDFYTFLALFLFISQATIIHTATSSTTNLVILFFAMSIMVLFHNDISEFTKKLLFITFSLSCIISHYSTSYIFFFVLLLTWLGMGIIPRILMHEKIVPSPNNLLPDNSLTGPHDSIFHGKNILPDDGSFIPVFRRWRDNGS